MNGIPLTRCQFLIPFANIHNEIGAPTTALLTKFRLPTSLEEKADLYVPILPAILFAEAVQRSQGITDLGFQASRRLEFCHLSEKLQAIIGNSPTLFTALQQLCKWARLEDTNVNVWLERHDDHLRICSRLAGTTGLLHLEHSQWLQNVVSMHIVRRSPGRAGRRRQWPLKLVIRPVSTLRLTGQTPDSCQANTPHGSMCLSRI